MVDQVNYDALDRAKNAFIQASKRTMDFAKDYGFVPEHRLGASANVFALDLKKYFKSGTNNLYMTLLPEGLGTADDARPNDLSPAELKTFWHNIAFKTVSCMTNDAASSGMQTVLISLYLPSSNPEVVFDESFLDGFLNGFVKACEIIKCVWISGETPQLKGKIVEGKLDIAGALVGMMPPNTQPIDGSTLAAGDKIVFIESSGPHENGFTPLRKIASELPQGYRTKISDGKEFWQAINAPSVLYTPLVQAILAGGIQPSAIENVTGHGWQKLMRSQKPLRYKVDKMLPVPPVFTHIEEFTGISKTEILKIFNYGVGCAIYLKTQEDAVRVVEIAQSLALNAVVAGTVEAAERREVVIEPLGVRLAADNFALKRE
jgi:phosphoribosylformylglycinamidine cyclo-ligase